MRGFVRLCILFVILKIIYLEHEAALARVGLLRQKQKKSP